MAIKREHSVYHDQVWAGTEHSYLVAVEGGSKVMAQVGVKAQAHDDDEDAPYNFSLQGNIGVVSIKGSLVNRDSEWNRYFGIMSYGEVRRALIHAAESPGVKAIVLDIASGGGAVNGVGDTANLISQIDSKVKPIYAFSDANMTSAAYWLGSSARKVYNSNLAKLGSIGVIAVHMEVSKMMEEQGVGVTVLRSGKYKALANQYEPLSEAGQKQVQRELDATYSVFVEHVAEARGVSVEIADQKMGQGREFIGAEAVDAGLSDGITSFDELMSKLSAKLLDSQGSSPNNLANLQRGLPMKRKALTEQDIAAIAAGAAPVTATVDGSAATPGETAAADPQAAASAPVTDPAAPEAAAGTEAPKAAEEPKKDDSAVLAFVQGELRAAQEQIVKLNVDLNQANAKVASMQTNHEGLLKIAAAAVRNMKVALGLSATDLTSLSAEQLLAEHASTSEAFQKAFKAGGVAAVNMPDEKAATGPALDPHYKARIAATRLTTAH